MATTTKRKLSGASAPAVSSRDRPAADSQSRQERIATAAYYRAEARGFVPGLELDDWLDAETEYNNANEENES
jgi:Protein of unknown function (DUF2934)